MRVADIISGYVGKYGIDIMIWDNNKEEELIYYFDPKEHQDPDTGEYSNPCYVIREKILKASVESWDLVKYDNTECLHLYI